MGESEAEGKLRGFVFFKLISFDDKIALHCPKFTLLNNFFPLEFPRSQEYELIPQIDFVEVSCMGCNLIGSQSLLG